VNSDRGYIVCNCRRRGEECADFIGFLIGCVIVWACLKMLGGAYGIGVEEGKRQAMAGKADLAVTEIVKTK
jgi:hypothetical protein